LEAQQKMAINTLIDALAQSSNRQSLTVNHHVVEVEKLIVVKNEYRYLCILSDAKPSVGYEDIAMCMLTMHDFLIREAVEGNFAPSKSSADVRKERTYPKLYFCSSKQCPA
jgi:hypothetical protein